MCPWVIRYRDSDSISGFNEHRCPRVILYAEAKTKVVQEHAQHQGRYAFEVEGYLFWEGTTAVIRGVRPKSTEDETPGHKNHNSVA